MSSSNTAKDTPLMSQISALPDQDTTGNNAGMFKLMTANKWTEKAKNAPTQQQLLNELLHENEVCILFADTGAGKSIFSLQLADMLSGGSRIAGFRAIAEAKKVLIIDFELTEKQREFRYSEQDRSSSNNACYNHYHFTDNLFFAQIDPEQLPPPQYEKQPFEIWVKASIEAALIATGATVLIVDNITYLSSEQEKAKDALPLMKALKELKNKYKLTLLCLAHTPKRDHTKPITKNDLQGSKMLINFCDSAFAIGESVTEKSVRYIKQIKARNTEIMYDGSNVMVFEIRKPTNFLHFSFIDFGRESDHLKVINETDKEQQEKEISALHNQGKSTRDIADAVHLSHTQVSRIIKRLTANS